MTSYAGQAAKVGVMMTRRLSSTQSTSRTMPISTRLTKGISGSGTSASAAQISSSAILGEWMVTIAPRRQAGQPLEGRRSTQENILSEPRDPPQRNLQTSGHPDQLLSGIASLR